MNSAIRRIIVPGLILSLFLFLNFNLSAQTKTQDKEQVKVQVQNQEKAQEKVQVLDQSKTQTANKNARGFVDLNGDGINDNAADSDNDGVPNCQDPDYKRPLDGTGNKYMKGNAHQNKTGKGGFGPGDGTGQSGVGPQDGSGYGPGTRSENCDGTGPKGKTRSR